MSDPEEMTIFQYVIRIYEFAFGNISLANATAFENGAEPVSALRSRESPAESGRAPMKKPGLSRAFLV